MTYFFVAIALLILIFILMYNSLIYKKNQVDNVFSTVDVLLQKRYDLIPNLVSVAKGYAEHERKIYTKVLELREKALSSLISNNEKISVNDEITTCLSHIFSIVENYPELKANEQFSRLQAAMCEIEEQISAARRAYNAMVTNYNTSIESIPTIIIAKALNFEKAALFKKELEIN